MGVSVDNLPVLIGNRHRVPGAVEVVGVELVGLSVDKADEAVAVDIVPCDLVAVIGFGEQVAGGINDVFCGDAAACRSDAVADAVIDILLVAVSNQPVGVVEDERRGSFAL